MVVSAKKSPNTKASTAPVAELRGLSKTYRLMFGKEVKALDDLTLDIRQGETFAIVGPNGSGKTTTMKLLLGLIFPTAGDATLFGKPLGDPEAQRRTGYLPEAPYFYEFLSGRELLSYFGKLCGVPKEILLPRIEQLLEMVDLQERGADMPIRVFSRGMRQRIGIAQAMINDPDLLILDEPTNGLDPIGTYQVRQFILEQKKAGRTMLLCSHLLSEVEAVADRVAILHRGRLLTVGQVSELVPESKQWQLLASHKGNELMKALVAAKFKVEQHGEVVTMLTDNLDDIYRALGMVTELGGQLLEITRPQPTLEEQFLKAVSASDSSSPVKETKKG